MNKMESSSINGTNRGPGKTGLFDYWRTPIFDKPTCAVRGIPAVVVEAVELLTHAKETPYEAYLDRIGEATGPAADLAKNGQGRRPEGQPAPL